jgi:hypothetical protein
MPESPLLPSKLPAAHAKRLAWALKAHGHLLSVAVRKDTSPEARQVEKLLEELIPEHVGRSILERADPTMAKTMTGWLVKQYAQGGLRLEDTGTAHETLDMFQRYGPKLPEDQRDLGKYQSLAEAWQVVFPLAEAEQDKLSGKAQKAMERDKAYAESRILRQDQDGFTVAVPLTEFAAKWWGRGTRWCTAAEKNNRFWHYHKNAPLIVVVIPELGSQGKFQLWAARNDVQFMDAADTDVPLDVIDRHWGRFVGLLLYCLCQGFDVVSFFPKYRLTEEICRIAVEHDGFNFAFVPQEFRTDEVCLLAAERCGYVLSEIPKDRRTPSLCKVAMEANASAFQYVPPEMQTAEMCRAVVMQAGWTAQYVSEGLLTAELCKLALGAHRGSLEHIPHAFRTEEICEIAVRRKGKDLQHVPLDCRTLEICRLALVQDGAALQWVPEDLRTEELVGLAVKQNGLAIMWASECLRTAELCEAAVDQNGDALSWVPRGLRTMEICMRALSHSGGALAWVPEALLTYEICEFAVRQSGHALKSVPKKLLTDELIKIAVAEWGLFLESIPKKRRNEEICEIAVRQTWSALRYVPKALRTLEMYKIAAAQDSVVLFEAPQHLRDQLGTAVPQPVATWRITILDEIACALSGPTKIQSAEVMHV